MTWIHPRDINRRKVFGPIWSDDSTSESKARCKRWNDCFARWLDSLKTKNELAETSLVYERRVRLCFTDPRKTPDRYTKQEIEKFLQEKNRHTGQKNKPASYNGKLATLKSFYAYAATYEYEYRGKIHKIMERNPPTFGIGILRTTSKSRALSDEELRRLFRAIDESKTKPLQKLRDRALFLTYLWSGRRCSEIARLRWDSISIVDLYDERIGSTRKGWVYRFRGKGHLSDDDCMEMPSDAVIAIITYLEADGRWEHMGPNDPIFPGKWPPKTMHPGSIANILHRYCAMAGIDEAGVHRFRHTAAMARWDQTKDIIYVQKFLRHKNLSATLVYVNPEQGRADVVAAQLRGRFGHL